MHWRHDQKQVQFAGSLAIKVSCFWILITTSGLSYQHNLKQGHQLVGVVHRLACYAHTRRATSAVKTGQYKRMGGMPPMHGLLIY